MSVPFEKEVLTHARGWMNLEHIMLPEVSQSRKDRHRVVPLTGAPGGVRPTGRRWKGGGQGSGEGSGEAVFNGDRDSVEEEGKFQRWARGLVQEREWT